MNRFSFSPIAGMLQGAIVTRTKGISDTWSLKWKRKRKIFQTPVLGCVDISFQPYKSADKV